MFVSGWKHMNAAVVHQDLFIMGIPPLHAPAHVGNSTFHGTQDQTFDDIFLEKGIDYENRQD